MLVFKYEINYKWNYRLQQLQSTLRTEMCHYRRLQLQLIVDVVNLNYSGM